MQSEQWSASRESAPNKANSVAYVGKFGNGVLGLSSENVRRLLGDGCSLFIVAGPLENRVTRKTFSINQKKVYFHPSASSFLGGSIPEIDGEM